jgi:aldose 1-epimerase
MVTQSKFGTLPDGRVVDAFVLANQHGLSAKVINYGATVTELHVPDRKGQLGDVVLGFDNITPYLTNDPYFGCTVGRVANRIAKGRFTLDGKTFSLAINNGANSLHGGREGFNKKLWKAEPLAGEPGVKFAYTSPDGEEGYPGKLETVVIIKLTSDNELSFDYTAKTDKPTPVNLTNHSYFNLHGAGDILGHELMLTGREYTPSDAELIPTGELKPVAGTLVDFTKPLLIGSRFSQLQTKPIGYDHNYTLGGSSLKLAARATDPKSGRVMEVRTTESAVQLYTGNFLNGSLTGKGGWAYQQYAGFCLETQGFPDAVNQPAFPSIIIRPGQTYRQTTLYKFRT